ncbi:MAG TPA: hypothetical protein VFI63_04320, partial [Solirubrobacterales bacterium]|nr:hypothetical protein [Solirubrobacterales bacterium]
MNHTHHQKGTQVSHTAPVTKAPFPRTGIFAALRGVLGGFQGSGARSSGALSSGRGRGRTSSLRLAGLATVLATAFLALTASSALAARGHEFTGTFGTPCTVALEPCGSGLLKEPSAVAVNEATGNIYVLDQGNDRVQEF